MARDVELLVGDTVVVIEEVVFRVVEYVLVVDCELGLDVVAVVALLWGVTSTYGELLVADVVLKTIEVEELLSVVDNVVFDADAIVLSALVVVVIVELLVTKTLVSVGELVTKGVAVMELLERSVAVVESVEVVALSELAEVVLTACVIEGVLIIDVDVVVLRTARDVFTAMGTSIDEVGRSVLVVVVDALLAFNPN